MSLYETMASTAAVRRYTDAEVDDETIYRALAYARFAPSGGNRQPWRVIVVRSAAGKRALRDEYVSAYEASRLYATRGPDAFASQLDRLPVLLVVCVELAALAVTDADLDRQSIVGGASIYPFVQNLLLALRFEGCGARLTTIAIAREPSIRDVLGIPDAFGIACMVPVGRPAAPAPRLRRHPVEEFAYRERFGGPPLPPPEGLT